MQNLLIWVLESFTICDLPLSVLQIVDDPKTQQLCTFFKQITLQEYSYSLLLLVQSYHYFLSQSHYLNIPTVFSYWFSLTIIF